MTRNSFHLISHLFITLIELLISGTTVLILCNSNSNGFFQVIKGKRKDLLQRTYIACAYIGRLLDGQRNILKEHSKAHRLQFVAIMLFSVGALLLQ